MEESDSSLNLMYNQVYPIVFLRHKLGIKSEDRYMLDMALALKSYGHRITFYTNSLDTKECFEELDPARGCFPVCHSGWWIPESFLGLFKKTMLFLKSIWLVLRMILLPPSPRPELILLDIHPFSLTLLNFLSSYKTFYIHHFPMLQTSSHIDLNRLAPRLDLESTMEYATEIIIQTRCLAEVFRLLYPNCKKQVRVLYPCVDIGLWREPSIGLTRIVPDLPKNSITFVVFGEYRKRSNFKLALDSLEHLLTFLEGPLREEIHMIIAGHCSEKSLDQLLYYKELVEITAERSYASQVTFLRQLPTVHKKMLLENCIAVVHPVKSDYFAGPVLAAMSLGKPVIAVNDGFPAEVLTHRISGILVDPIPEKFAAAMLKLATKPTVQHFIGEMAKDTFRSHFTFQSFSRKLHSLVIESQKPHLEYL